MLTADLVRARVVDGEVRPGYLDVENEASLALAAELLAVFAEHVGRSRGSLDAALREVLGTGTAFLLHRGLAKLLMDRAEFDTAAARDPETLRRRVFAAAAAARRAAGAGDHFERDAVVAAVAAEEGLDAGEVERGLYADLKDEQVLASWEPCSARQLLERYNVALAQGVLLRAEALEVRLAGGSPRQHRALFQRVKFFRLMHTVARRDGAWVVHLDGPLSLFRAGTRYGVQMASFLPTLLHLEGWEIEATVRWGPRRGRRTFRLAPTPALRPHGRLPGQWRPEELDAFRASFEALASDWELTEEAELVDLGGEGVLVPDFVFVHRPTGVQAVMEVLGFWRRGAVEKRLRLLRRHGPEHLVLAVSKQLAGDEEALADLPGEVYVFRKTPLAREVLRRLDALAVPREGRRGDGKIGRRRPTTTRKKR